MGILNDPIVLTSVGAAIAYIPHAIHKYGPRTFDVYARTAELEHEHDIPHIDPKVIKACKVNHDALPNHYATQVPNSVFGMIKLGVGSILTPNEAREMEGRIRHSLESGGRTMVLPEPCRYESIPIYPDPDILEDEAYNEWVRDGSISPPSCTCNNCMYEGPGDYECVYIMADNQVIDVLVPDDDLKSHPYIRKETTQDRLFKETIEAMRDYKGESQ